MIRKRRNGLQVQVYAGRDPLTGRKRYVSQQVDGQTKASMREAKQIEARLLEEVGAGRHKGSRSRTMAELLDRWLEWRPTVRPIAPTTVSSYRAAMDRYILPALGKLPVRQVDAATLDAFYAQLRTRGGKDGRPLKASTVHEVHAVLSGALKQAVVWGWIGHNPAKLATAPSVQKADVQPPQAEDAARLLSAAMAEDPELGLFLRLAVVLGARRGELCALRWSDWSCPGSVDRSGLGRSVVGLVAPFVVGGAELAKGGVAPPWVVEAFQVVEDGHPCLGPGAEAVAVQQFAFQGGEEALGHGVVIAVTDRAHRGGDASLTAAPTERQRGVLGGFNWS